MAKTRSGNEAAAQKAASGAYIPNDRSLNRRARYKYSLRLWSVRHAGLLEAVYSRFAAVFLRMHPLWRWLGYHRAERPVSFIERHTKGLLFDCRMCGQCILSSTGMSCPMNCPKQLRNGPCGGVRPNGHCEVEPDMPCVWVQAWTGAQSMRGGDAILTVQPPVDQSLCETSAWLRTTAATAKKRVCEKKVS